MHNSMQEFTFDTVTVDTTGAIIARRRCVARQFVEPLADDVILEMVAIPGFRSSLSLTNHPMLSIIKT